MLKAQMEDLDVALRWLEASQTGWELGLLLSSCRRGEKELGHRPVDLPEAGQHSSLLSQGHSHLGDRKGDRRILFRLRST